MELFEKTFKGISMEPISEMQEYFEIKKRGEEGYINYNEIMEHSDHFLTKDMLIVK